MTTNNRQSNKLTELKLTELSEWLSSKNNFSEARKLINNIRADTNKVKSSSKDEKVFNGLNGLINDIQNTKTKSKSSIKKSKKYYFQFSSTKAKKSTVLQNKMSDVA